MNAALFRRLACRPAAFCAVWDGQTERETPLYNLKLHAARFRVCVGLAALAGVDCGIGGQPVLIGLSFLRLCHAIGLFFGDFLRLLTWEKWRFSNRSEPDDVWPCPTRSYSIKCVFSGSTQESASFVPRDRFFSERMEESPQIITLNYILIARQLDGIMP